MNTIVGTITLEGNHIISEEFDFDTIPSLTKDGNKTIYFFGETKIKSSKTFLEKEGAKLGKILFSDISISSEENVFLDPFDFEEGIYEVANFEGEQITFGEIKKRFEGNEEVFSIREAGISNKFGNKIIKVDFVY